MKHHKSEARLYAYTSIFVKPVHTQLTETVDSIRSLARLQPVVGLILGSGLGDYAESFSSRVVIPFSDLPHFPCSTIPGHSGNLIIGLIADTPVIALQGRVHLYEGYSVEQVVFPTRVLARLGIRQLIVTNAAGGINRGFRPGDLMLITDHINMTGVNPLVGRNFDELGPRFPDMSEAYNAGDRKIALAEAQSAGIELRQGVYVGLLGPSFETPAEIRMFQTLGADAVGMSTVAEVIAANHMGIDVLGISCITNMAAGILPQKLTHAEVIDTTQRVKENFQSLLTAIIPRLIRETNR